MTVFQRRGLWVRIPRGAPERRDSNGLESRRIVYRTRKGHKRDTFTNKVPSYRRSPVIQHPRGLGALLVAGYVYLLRYIDVRLSQIVGHIKVR